MGKQAKGELDLCLCADHIRELIQTNDKNEKVLKFPQNVLNTPTFDKIPPACYTLTELNKFYFEKLGCIKISSKIQMFQNLTTLSLFRNDLTKIPDSISKITCLKKVNFAHNRLMEMPNFPKSLEDLDISSNFIPRITIELQDMPKLDRALLSCNEISEVWPSAFDGNDSLTQLDISKNKLTRFPESIENLQKLEWLDLSRNSIQNFRENILENAGLVSSLRALYIAYNELTMESIKIISGLKNVDTLNLSGNFLQTLPEELGNLKFLHTIWLTNNRFTEFPEILTKFKFLGCLDLTDNKITFVDEEALDFKFLTRGLATFEMGNNGLIVFPEVISSMKRLLRLNLSNNKVEHLSMKMAKYFKDQFGDEFNFVRDTKFANYEDGVLLFNNKFVDKNLVDLIENGHVNDILSVVKEDPPAKDYRLIASKLAGEGPDEDEESSDDEELSQEEFLRKRYGK